MTNDIKGTNKRAQGRTLAEFEPLGPAEQKLLDACRSGEVAVVSPSRPTEKSADIYLRPEFLRFLVLGGDENAPIHEKGVRLRGAWIEGDIDLESCSTNKEMALYRCNISGTLNLRSADVKNIFLDGSSIEGFDGDRLRCRGNVHFRRGFQSTKAVRLLGARIGGNLDCAKGQFKTTTKVALDCFQIQTGGSIYLAEEFHAAGEVRLTGARIAGTLTCTKGFFDGNTGVALTVSNSRIEGNVSLNGGFHSIGDVRFNGAHIGGNLICEKGQFEQNNSDSYSLNCNRARIEGTLLFRDVAKVDAGKSGVIAFLGAHAATLTDDASSWQAASALVLDGFTYDRITGVRLADEPGNPVLGDAPRDAKTRIAWLDRQLQRHLQQDFRPQPWQQLARVLMEMGHEDDARTILIEMRMRQRTSRWKYQAAPWERRLSFLRTRLDWLLGLLVAYGYRPTRAMLLLFLLWLAGGLIYRGVASAGIMAPTDAHFYLDSRIPPECKIDWIRYAGPQLPSREEIVRVPDENSRARLRKQIADDASRRRQEAARVDLDATEDWSWKAICDRAVPSEYSVFQPFVYSIDIVLPFLELRQERDFAPRILDGEGTVLRPLFTLPSWLPLVGGTWGLGYLVRLWEWLEIFFGWMLTILIAASVSGIIKKD